MPIRSFAVPLCLCLAATLLSGCVTYQNGSIKAPAAAKSWLLEPAESEGADVSGQSAERPEVKEPQEVITPSSEEDALDIETGALTERVQEEQAQALNPFVLTAHKHNYILPVSYSNRVNEFVYQQNDVPLREGLRDVEVKFQISLKTQLNEKSLFFSRDALSLGITLEAWWQLYLSDLSSPFRESNYQPEIFYLVPLLWGPWGGNTALSLGLEHQSNGQVQGLSRSWNRLYATFIYERGPLLFALKPWYRLPEKAKRSPEEAEGDDNPDIVDFMGIGEAAFSWRNQTFEYSMRGRGNPSTGKGAITIGMTFPLFARFRGFVQLFSGYGDSLIDYNHHQTRLGLGVALTSLY